MSQVIERPRASCALGGAVATITALRDAAPVIHASAGCGGNIFNTLYGGSGYQGAGYCGGLAVPSSNVTEREILFGGEERLVEQIETTRQVIDAKLFAILSGCMTEIIGDDIASVARRFQSAGDTVIAVQTGGFNGNAYGGYGLVLETLFRDVVLPAPQKEMNRINLWGLVPGQDPFWRGDLLELKRLLRRLGLQVTTFFSHDEGLDDLRHAGRAAANIVLSPVYGVQAAEVFQAEHGTPYLPLETPIGPTATADFLRQVGRRLNVPEETVATVIREEQAEYYHFVERVADFYTDTDQQHHAVVVGNATMTIPLTRFLTEDLGWLPEFVVVTDPLPAEQQERLRQNLATLRYHRTPQLLFETDTTEIPQRLARHWPIYKEAKYHRRLSPAFVLGSSLERDLASTIGAKHLSVSFPITNRVVLHRGYAGYRGGLHLLEDLLNVAAAGR
ncbi:hypothetical protein GTO89_02300 [Heliobacterium gestii]|uniref:Nitrogenase/oxidoreductase component 1 domain-containing protein n=1 Tax=Heliomicrobium gestii TaxID=2699 RepID=A0A845LE92_HELGE|nr:nitrogenase component 1 [Heliomicrobium gestii]MBM7865613.1 nitrogenase molybdenum-iron protein beta chain [Heliomicrobium gestii]MZP41863.1 hypothetical protein [Heliomicrobium gestii]